MSDGEADEAREALLVASDLRVDVDDVPACDGLDLRTTGQRVLVLGAPRALFEAASGQRSAARGGLTVGGAPARDAVRDARVAGCALDPPLPPRWTALEYVTWSARLAGHRAADATLLVDDAIARVQLGVMARTPLAQLVPHAKRAVVLAAALATGASTIVLDDPLAALPEEIARTWARIVVKALAERAWIVFAGRVPLTSPLALEADEAIVVASSRVLTQGSPASIAAANRRFVARIHGSTDALSQRLAAAGAQLEVQGAQVLLDLGDAVTTADLLGMCVEVDVTIVEMLPLARALS